MNTPVLYSFRRCPYAIRARMALAHAGVECELREILLNNKPQQLLAISSKGTVPVLQLGSRVIDESLDVMAWALSQRGLADDFAEVPFPHPLVEINDTEFKYYLDRYKYFEQYPNQPQAYYLEKCMPFLIDLEKQLSTSHYLLGEKPSWVDFAIFPFIRQFAFVDKKSFDTHSLPAMQKWLAKLIASDMFKRVMLKYPVWEEGQERLLTDFAGHINKPHSSSIN